MAPSRYSRAQRQCGLYLKEIIMFLQNPTDGSVILPCRSPIGRSAAKRRATSRCFAVCVLFTLASLHHSCSCNSGQESLHIIVCVSSTVCIYHISSTVSQKGSLYYVNACLRQLQADKVLLARFMDEFS